MVYWVEREKGAEPMPNAEEVAVQTETKRKMRLEAVLGLLLLLLAAGEAEIRGRTTDIVDISFESLKLC